MTSLLKKLSISIEIGVIKRYGLESAWLVSKLLTESVGSRRELVAVVFTPPTPTRQNSFVASASAVCIGHYSCNAERRCQISRKWTCILRRGLYAETNRNVIFPKLGRQVLNMSSGYWSSVLLTLAFSIPADSCPYFPLPHFPPLQDRADASTPALTASTFFTVPIFYSYIFSRPRCTRRNDIRRKRWR